MNIVKTLHNHLSNKLNWYNRYHHWEHHHKVHWAVLAVYVLGVVAFGLASLNQAPKAQAVDPEITLGSPTSGNMPSTASVIMPPGGYDVQETVYDLGAVYTVTSALISCSHTSIDNDNPDYGVGWKLFISTNGSSYSEVLSDNPPSPLDCPIRDIIPSVQARYAKWQAYSDTDINPDIISTPPNDTYSITLSSPHLYGTQSSPTVSISSPSPTAGEDGVTYYANTTPLTGSGTAIPVSPATISTVNGNLSSSVTDAQNWTASGIALSAGSNTWTVTATDSNGYTGNDSQTIFLDTTNPIISANTPTCSTSNSVAVTGTASDANAGLKTSNPITYTVNGGSTQNGSGSTSWTATASSLTEGDHTVAITATDKASNTASVSKTAQYDPTAPTITVSSSSTSSSASYILTGTTSDATSGVASVNAGTGTSGTTSWSRAVTLTSGANAFSITATDNCGNTSNASSFIVTYTPSNNDGDGDTPPPTPDPDPEPNPDDCTTLTITSPNGGESYLVGVGTNAVSSTTITWNKASCDTDNVNLSYTTGSSYTTIATNEANDGSYTWTLPTNLKSTTVKVKIQHTTNLSIQDTSDTDFTIHSNSAPGISI